MTDMMPIKDIAGLGQPITKLIETVGNAVGVVYEPTRIRRKAKAEADAAIIAAEASVKVQSLELRASERNKRNELRRQRNIEKITEIASNQLPDKVSDEKVEEDWTVQFFNYSQDIGNEEMQMIWGKILAGEITQPGSFSLRTLSIVKTLDKEDALLFKKICNYKWRNIYIITYGKFHDFIKEKRGVVWENLLDLETLGLINLNVTWELKPAESYYFSYYGITYKFTNNKDYNNKFHGHRFTQAGNELSSICEREPDTEYISELVQYYSQEKSPISIEVAT